MNSIRDEIQSNVPNGIFRYVSSHVTSHQRYDPAAVRCPEQPGTLML